MVADDVRPEAEVTVVVVVGWWDDKMVVIW